jgi:hypothetical protein
MPTNLSLLEDLNSIIPLSQWSSGKEALTVDREAGIIKGIKILGFTSQNGRRYTPEACKAAISLYEGKKVNIDHPEKGPTQQRSTYDRFGKFINVRFVEGDGLFGDLLYLKSHEMAESVCEAAERKELNDVFGMSHNAQGEGSVDKQGIFVVSRITEVRHVDLVADPATTQSLTESASAKQKTEEAAYSGVYRTSKKRSPKARRGFVKSKSKSANKPTGTIKESEDETTPVVNEEESDRKDLHHRIMQIIIRDDMADDRKADAVLDFLMDELGDVEMDATEAMDRIDDTNKDQKSDVPDDSGSDDTEEAKGTKKCAKCGCDCQGSMDAEEAKCNEEEGSCDDGKERMKPVKESKDSNEELKYLRAKDNIRNLCEQAGIKFEDSLVEDLSGLSASSLERQIKRIAASEKAAKPKCPPVSAPLQESKGSGIPEGDSLFRWLQN